MAIMEILQRNFLELYVRVWMILWMRLRSLMILQCFVLTITGEAGWR